MSGCRGAAPSRPQGGVAWERFIARPSTRRLRRSMTIYDDLYRMRLEVLPLSAIVSERLPAANRQRRLEFVDDQSASFQSEDVPPGPRHSSEQRRQRFSPAPSPRLRRRQLRSPLEQFPICTGIQRAAVRSAVWPPIQAVVKWYNPDKGFGFVQLADGFRRCLPGLVVTVVPKVPI
jgi:hypothetical protein